MPQVLPIIAYYAVSSMPIAYAAAWGFAASLGTSLVVNNYERRKALAKARDAFNASLHDRLVMTSTADRTRSRIYGRARNCDGVLFKQTHGVDKRDYTLVIAVAGYEVDAIEDVYFNDIKLDLDANGNPHTAPYVKVNRTTASENIDLNGTGSVTLAHTPVTNSVHVYYTVEETGPAVRYDVEVACTVSGSTVSVTPGGYPVGTGRATYQYDAEDADHIVRVRKYTGAPGQDLSADLIATVGSDLVKPGVHRFEGIACLLVTLQYDTDAFPNGVPLISAVCRGMKLYDPRTGLTRWRDPNSPSTGPHPGENPALAALDWARFSHGGDLELTEVELQSFIDAANASDTSTEFVTATRASLNESPTEYVTLTEPRYLCGTVVSTGAPADRVLDDMVLSMAGAWGWSGGKLKVRAGAWRTPVTTLTEDWIASNGNIQADSNVPIQETINILKPTIADATQNYVVLPQTDVRAESYIEQDGQELPDDIDFACVTWPHHALDICEVRLLEARQALTVELTCKLHAFQLELFDIVYVTLSRFGWSAKAFEVLKWSFDIAGGVRLFLREVAASTYDPATLFTLNDVEDNTELPSPWVTEEIQGLTASSVASLDNDQQLVTRTLVTWLPVVAMAVRQSGYVEVQWATLGLAPTTMQWVNNSSQTLPWANAFGFSLNWFTDRANALTDENWASVMEPGTSTSTTIIGLRSGYAYVIRARVASTLVRGPWSVQKFIVIPTIAATDASALAAAQAAATAAAASAAAASAAASEALDGVQDAIDAANTAAAAADAAADTIAALSSDDTISAVEKPQIIKEYDVIVGEQAGIDARAQAFGIDTESERTNYDNSITALVAYLATLTTPTAWNNTAGDTNLGTGGGYTFRATFVTVYTSRQALLNKIAEEAGKRAAWASVTGIPYESIYTNDDAVALGFNPTFSAWTGAYPDGWSQWSGVAPTKETTLVRIGPYSVRFAPAGGNLGMQAQSVWTTTPMAVGTFIAGSIDIYLVARTSGLPGLGVELFTNAALSTSVLTSIQPPSAGVGSWQRVTFTARVGAAENIYGIRLYVLASRTTLPSGAFTGTVIFSNLRLAFFDQSTDNTRITLATDGTLSGAGGGQVTITGLGYSGDLNATYGANATNFTGRVGVGNLMKYSAFRVDTDADGMSNGWAIYNNSPGTEPVTPTRVVGGGMFGGDAQVVTWSVNNTSTKGIYADANFAGGLTGGWEPNQWYVISWYAKATGTNVGQTMQTAWNYQPVSAVALLNPALTSSYQRYAFRIQTGASVEARGQIYLTIAINGLTQGSLTFSAIDVTRGDVLSEYVESVEDIRVAAAAAAALADQAEQAAGDAQADASSALVAITDMASDSVLTPVEKPTIIADYTAIVQEQAGIDAQATTFGITTEKTAYDNAVTALTNYLNTLTSPVAWNNLSGNTTFNGTTLRGQFVNLYTARQVLLNRIADVAGQRATWLNLSGRPNSYRVVSNGAYAASPPGATALTNAETGAVLFGAARTYLMVRIRRSDRVITSQGVYDVYVNGGSALATDLNNTGNDHIVVVYTSEEPSVNRTSGGLPDAMYRCGASRGVFGSPQFMHASAYILIGIGGCGEGNGAEFYQGQTPNDINAWCDAFFMITNEGNLIVTGSSAVPRTLADYGAGGLAYLSTVGTAQIDPNATTETTETHTSVVTFDDVLTYPVYNATFYLTYSTYTQGNGLVSVGSITPFGTTKVNITLTGSVHIFLANMNASIIRVTVNLRNGTTVIDSTMAQGITAGVNDPLGPGRAIDIPVSLSWQGNLSAATQFNTDLTLASFQDNGVSAEGWNVDYDGSTTHAYVLFNLNSTIVNYKR